MRKILFLVVILAVTALPGLGFMTAQAASCSNSYPTEFGSASTGHIAQAFSTFRHVPAGAEVARVLAPAEFTVYSQKCVDGYSWIELEYTSGSTDYGTAASSLGRGWALESQLYDDYYNGPGRWLTSGIDSGSGGGGGAPAPSGDCSYSYATAFGSGGATSGHIVEAYSTLRSAPGASGTVIVSPAEFDVLDQGCFDGLSWVEIEYTSGYTEGGASAVGMTGWALESQYYGDYYWGDYDYYGYYGGYYGAGIWLAP